jgi:UDP-N-acetyl-2-amino-2-deoxyglucuronate dehydrogenase
LKNFVLIGAAGYIAPKHLKAIKETGNNLLAAFDIHDSVGILDSYFPQADFFTEFERFDRHCEKLRRNNIPIHYVSVCSPNYLHDAHCRFGLRMGADVICEKPVVLNPWNAERLMEMEMETGKRIFSLLQLRYHPEIMALKERIRNELKKDKHSIELIYITPRGKWYQYSWKGDVNKSGGIVTNIGIHFFDLLCWIFGKVQKQVVAAHTTVTASGQISLERAEVNWFLSIDENTIRLQKEKEDQPFLKILRIDGTEIQFSQQAESLHTRAYEAVLQQQGVTLEEIMLPLQLVHIIRQSQVT